MHCQRDNGMASISNLFSSMWIHVLQMMTNNSTSQISQLLLSQNMKE